MHGSKLNQEALSTYSKSFSSLVLDKFFSQNQGINGQQIISVTPIKQINFFVLKVLFAQWQEETKKFKSPFFNYKNADVNGALKNLVNTLSKNILIEKEDFRPLLEKATHDAITLAYDPATFYIENIPSTKKKDFRGMSKYIKIYKPLFDQLALALEKDAEKEQSALMNPVLDAYVIDSEEQAKFIAEISNVLEMNVLEKPNAPIEEPVSPADIPEISSSEAFGESSREPESINGHNAPISEEINEEFNPLSKAKKPDASLVHDQYAEEEVKTLNKKFEEEKVQETIASKHEETSSSDLASSISINQRYMFLGDLFEGNEEDYQTALTHIDAQSSFDDSVEFLMQNFAKKYSWDMSSDEVKEFLKVIFKRFR